MAYTACLLTFMKAVYKSFFTDNSKNAKLIDIKTNLVLWTLLYSQFVFCFVFFNYKVNTTYAIRMYQNQMATYPASCLHLWNSSSHSKGPPSSVPTVTLLKTVVAPVSNCHRKWPYWHLPNPQCHNLMSNNPTNTPIL